MLDFLCHMTLYFMLKYSTDDIFPLYESSCHWKNALLHAQKVVATKIQKLIKGGV